MAENLAKELLELEDEGMVTFYVYLNEEALVVTPIICLICDNPRASELVNHLAMSATYCCRMCLEGCPYNKWLACSGQKPMFFLIIV